MRTAAHRGLRQLAELVASAGFRERGPDAENAESPANAENPENAENQEGSEEQLRLGLGA